MQKINVEEQLNILIRLQALDAQLYRLRKEREAKPKLIEELEARRNEEQAAVKGIEEKSKTNQLKRKQKEMDLQTEEESVKKLSTQLYQIKTNKEYQTMQHEIEGHKADNSLLEDEILAIMEEADSFSKELIKERELFAEAERRLNEDRKKIEGEIAVIDNEIANFESQREELTAQVDKKVLSQYEKVLANREGVALVAVKNHACQGCFINLPPQVINEIRMKDKITVCESCARILYIENDADV
ncbi:MAG: C4-type zinc ribbon domain-containing protein [Candidatus Omnitrophota bacterium]|nr:C4-type zinc ribbon domain-containing protein [Candidatus Omnitrophota bacterium]